VFERFTDRARRVLVLAQEEARLLNHNFIGTEHLLLGLVQEGDGVAARVIAGFGISLDDVRAKVHEAVGPSTAVLVGSAPFTPRAKKVLELALREALQLGHNYIGTEHILLGLVREGEGVGAQVLSSLGIDLVRVRHEVTRLLAGSQLTDGPMGTVGLQPVTGLHRGELVECSFCGRRPPESGQLVAGRGGAYVCEHCVGELKERLAADSGKADSEKADSEKADSEKADSEKADSEKTVESGPRSVVITGRLPVDEEAARMAVSSAFDHALVLSEDRRTVPGVEGGELLGPCLKEAQERHAALRHSHGTVTVDHVQFLDEEHASVMVALALEGVPSTRVRGEALLVDSVWKVSRATFCQLMQLAGVACPPI
jgi:hypothetical protein